MRVSLYRPPAQPLIGIVTLMLGLLLLVGPWLHGAFNSPELAMRPTDPSQAMLSMFLVAALVLSHRFPVHIRGNSKLYMGSATLYLMAALLPPPLAMTAVGLGSLAGELMVRSQRGLYLSDVATQVGRLMIVVLLGSLVAHMGTDNNILHSTALVATAAVCWAGDLLTLPLVLAPISGENSRRIILTAARDGGVAEASQYLVGIMGALVVKQEIWALALLILPTALVYVAFKSAEKMRLGTRRMLEGMADTVDLRDPYTGGHSRRVAELANGILQELDVSGPEANLILWAARVHDIGKIGIPDAILHKEGPLNAEERALMETHPDRGAGLLARYPDFAPGVDIVRYHHERWDGAGYPHGLKGQEIPFGARVIAVADSFDAMTSTRPYRQALAVERAAAILLEGRGRQWDPRIVDAFMKTIADRLSQPIGKLLWVVPDPPRATEEIKRAAESG